MNKAEYLQIRSELDFKANTGRFIAHIFQDFVLMGITWGLLFFPARELGLLAGQYALASVLACVLYFRSFSLMHDAVHGSLLSNKKWNDIFGVYGGILSFLPFEHWREIHLLHHQWAGNVERDPVMRLVLDFRKPPTSSRKVINFLWTHWFPILAIMQEQLFWLLCITRFWQKKEERTLKRTASLALPIFFWSLFVCIASWRVVAFAFVPSIFMYLLMVEVVNFPHHLNLPQNEGEKKLALWEQHEIARSCFYPKLLSRFVFLNFNYHTEHHLFPTLPWHRLDHLAEKLRAIVPGYNFSEGNAWILANRTKPIEDVTKEVPQKNKEAA